LPVKISIRLAHAGTCDHLLLALSTILEITISPLSLDEVEQENLPLRNQRIHQNMLPEFRRIE
jgi:hypothetical protein